MTDAQIDAWFDASSRGDLVAMEQLIQQGMDVNTKLQGVPLIIPATIQGYQTAVEFLLDHGISVDARDNDNSTALMWASHNGNINLVNLLLSRGANINAANLGGCTPFEHAESSGHDDILRLLWSRSGRPGVPRTVLVLGAGFTKGFFPNAPVLVDTFGVRDVLLPKYANFPAAKDILETEIRQSRADGYGLDKVNLERLMTRLAGGMPYDRSHEASPILQTLLADLMKMFIEKIRRARSEASDPSAFDELRSFATYCLDHNVDIVTFNYDDLLDQALDEASANIPRLYQWHPNNGYGFFCRPSPQIIGLPVNNEIFHATEIRLLKIHGSMNWHVQKGASPPYGVGDFFHNERWSVANSVARPADLTVIDTYDRIDQQLEPEPFIVPPVLTKSDLVNQPLLQLLWTQAFDVLKQAQQIIFVGYSLPVTDIATSYLLTEARAEVIDALPKITVVDFASPTETRKREEIKQSYSRVFLGLQDNDFHFDGARAWAQRFVEGDQARNISW